MSESEKQAIEKVTNLTPDDLLNCWEGGEEEFEAIQIVLNLISKLQKENTELKEENTILEGNKIGLKLAIQELIEKIKELK